MLYDKNKEEEQKSTLEPLFDVELARAQIGRTYGLGIKILELYRTFYLVDQSSVSYQQYAMERVYDVFEELDSEDAMRQVAQQGSLIKEYFSNVEALEWNEYPSHIHVSEVAPWNRSALYAFNFGAYFRPIIGGASKIDVQQKPVVGMGHTDYTLTQTMSVRTTWRHNDNASVMEFKVEGDEHPNYHHTNDITRDEDGVVHIKGIDRSNYKPVTMEYVHKTRQEIPGLVASKMLELFAKGKALNYHNGTSTWFNDDFTLALKLYPGGGWIVSEVRPDGKYRRGEGESPKARPKSNFSVGDPEVLWHSIESIVADVKKEFTPKDQWEQKYLSGQGRHAR